MNSVDIYWQEKVYVGLPNNWDVKELPNYISYPLSGSHNFRDGEDVTGRWKKQYQMDNSPIQVGSFLQGVEDVWVKCSKETYDKIVAPNKRIVAIAAQEIEMEDIEAIDNAKVLSINDIKSCFAPDRSFVGVQWLFDRIREKVKTR